MMHNLNTISTPFLDYAARYMNHEMHETPFWIGPGARGGAKPQAEVEDSSAFEYRLPVPRGYIIKFNGMPDRIHNEPGCVCNLGRNEP